MLKFCLPWDPGLHEFNAFLDHTIEEAIHIDDETCCRILNSNAPMSIVTFGGVLKIITSSDDSLNRSNLRLATCVVKHGIINSDLNVGIIITPQSLEVRSEDRRLSLIILSSLKEFYSYYVKNNMSEGA